MGALSARHIWLDSFDMQNAWQPPSATYKCSHEVLWARQWRTDIREEVLVLCFLLLTVELLQMLLGESVRERGENLRVHHLLRLDDTEEEA